MILFFMILALIGSVGWLWYKDFQEYSGFVVMGVIGVAVMIIIYLSSFGTAVGIEATYYGVVGQYRDAIEEYKDDAVVINIKPDTFTDFRYQGYQESVAEMIKDLRWVVSRYNKSLIQKRLWKKSVFINWFIVLPSDELKLISLKEK